MSPDADTPLEPEQMSKSPRHLRSQLVASVSLAALTTGFVYVALWNLPALAAKTSGVGVAFALPALAILFFWVRCRFRLYYGLAEFGTGLVTAYHIFCAPSGVGERDVGLILGSFGGLYLMVRGLESVGLAIRQPRLRTAWDRFFSGITDRPTAGTDHR